MANLDQGNSVIPSFKFDTSAVFRDLPAVVELVQTVQQNTVKQLLASGALEFHSKQARIIGKMMTAHLAALPPTNTLTSGLASIDLSPILNAYRRAAITRNVLLASRHEDGVPSKPNEALHLDGIDPDDLLAEALSFEAHWDNPDVDIEVAAFFDSRPDDAQGIQMLPLVLRVPGEKERAAMVKLLQVTFYMIAMQFIVLVSSDNPTLAGWIGASGFAADTVFTSTKATARRLVDSVADSDPNDLEGVNPMWTETDPE